MRRGNSKLMILGGIVGGLALIGGVDLASAITYQNATDVVFTFNPVVSLSVSGDLSINDLRPGNSADSNTITVTASSNAMGGYALYSNVGNSTYNTTELRLNGTDTTNKFTVLSSAVSSLANFGDSNWGYSYCNTINDCTTASNWVYGSTGSTNTGYGIMPLYNDASHTGDVKLVDTAASSATTLNFKIGAKASSSQVAGAYTNVVNFINVPKIITIDYTLNYLDSSGTTTSGTLPAASTGTTTDGTFTITTSRPANTNTNYVFKGWCTENNSSDVTACPGATIYPGNLYTIGSSSSTFTGNVYAVWQDNTPIITFDDAFASAGKTKLNNHYKMQDMTSSICESITLGQEGQLIDMRDNKIYYVAKLPDERCWMTQNLDHDISSSYNYNSTNTDVPSSPGTLTSTYATGTTTWNFSTTTPESYDPGDRCWNGTLDPNYSTKLDTGTIACSSITTTPDHYHIGNYYKWTASVAMQNSSSYTADNTDVNQSICPAGWMLPKKTGSGSFYDLVNGRYTSGTSGNIQSSPVYFVYGGYWIGSSTSVSSYGVYWSSVVRDSYYSYDLVFNVGGLLGPQDDYDRAYGLPVRCLAR